MKYYTIQLSRSILKESVLANSAKEAVEKAKGQISDGNDYFVQDIYDEIEDQSVLICSICSKDVVSGGTYTEDGDFYCSECYAKP